MKAQEFPPIVKMMDEGVQERTKHEARVWNERDFENNPELDRFPLSPSQMGKCALALARNLSHYLGVADYPRREDYLSPRTQRIFARGHLLESALIDDLGSYAGLTIEARQARVRLFPLSDVHALEGNIDGIAVAKDGTRILIDIKSKGAFYSAGFNDSISEFFIQLRETGLVQQLAENSFLIADPKALFDMISLDDFFVDYLLQLNGYALGTFVETGKPVNVDFVALYYENKNTCANYEVRWTPSVELLKYAQEKMRYVYSTVKKDGPEAVPKEFGLGSARCRLCDYNEKCWGKYVPPIGTRQQGKLDDSLDRALRAAQREHHVVQKVEEEVLRYMDKNDLTHITTSDGLVYERKYLKSPKPHFELRLSK